MPLNNDRLWHDFDFQVGITQSIRERFFQLHKIAVVVQHLIQPK